MRKLTSMLPIPTDPARTALDEANAKVGEKDYETAKASAIRAKDLADQARSEGEANKQRSRDEAQAIVNRTSTGLTDARTAINGAQRGKGADDDIDQLRSDLGQVETGLSDARGNLNSGRFKDAVDQARNAESRLGSGSRRDADGHAENRNMEREKSSLVRALNRLSS